ncbi:P-loop NTPase fold protein [Silvanigrella aquatica]|uniref:KAP NTPase domain-containing protein n=1 Tax=Silvanigrella aquatica TaxID=1915309 RepID=A0A1L4D2E2_9BACT|nr:P-loop NTPase fold protein [Silvanigrella aquatica]APJ04360.1 hypothetical protein AXG55_10765 [Silvanigrella aquatica]
MHQHDNTSLKECWSNFKRLISHDPPLLRKTKEKLEAHDGIDEHKSLNYESIKHQIDIYIHKNENLIFLIGPWGSGKTYLIEKYSHEIQEGGLHFIKKSFFGIKSLNAAYVHLLGIFKTGLFLFVIYTVIYRFGFYESNFFAPLFIVLSLMLLTNRMNITYSFYKFISSLVDILITSGFHLAILTRKVLDMRDLRNFKHKVYILDDLDRSSLKDEDRWALLANLWNYNTTYIVLLGYSEDDRVKGKSKLELIEFCEKLEGKIIFLPIAWERNEEIMNFYLSQIFSNFNLSSPFQSPIWNVIFTPRELINIADHFKIKFEEYQIRHKGYENTGGIFFDCLLIRSLMNRFIDKAKIIHDHKIYLIKQTQNDIPKDILKFYNSINQFLNTLDSYLVKLNNLKEQPNSEIKNKENQELLEIIFLHSEEKMLKFFDDTTQIWTDNNDKKEIP